MFLESADKLVETGEDRESGFGWIWLRSFSNIEIGFE